MLTISKPLTAGKAESYHKRESTSKESSYWVGNSKVILKVMTPRFRHPRHYQWKPATTPRPNSSSSTSTFPPRVLVVRRLLFTATPILDYQHDHPVVGLTQWLGHPGATFACRSRDAGSRLAGTAFLGITSSPRLAG